MVNWGRVGRLTESLEFWAGTMGLMRGKGEARLPRWLRRRGITRRPPPMPPPPPRRAPGELGDTSLPPRSLDGG